jgi:hypothetical protein
MVKNLAFTTSRHPAPPAQHSITFTRDELCEVLCDYLRIKGTIVPKGKAQLFGIDYDTRAGEYSDVMILIREDKND